MGERIKSLQNLLTRGNFEDSIEYISSQIEKFGWNETRQILLSGMESLSWYQQYQAVLTLFRIEVLNGIDSSASELLNFESESKTYEAIREDLSNHALRLLENQFENNGSTLFFDIDAIEKTGFAHLIPDIIEIRKSQFLWVYKRFMEYDYSELDNLALTYYGYKLLESLKVLPPENKMLKLLNNIFAKMNDLPIHDRDMPIKISKEFRELALIIVPFIDGERDELVNNIKLVEIGYPHLPAAFQVLTSNLKLYNLYIGNEDTTALHARAIQILEFDKSAESTEYLIDILESLTIDYVGSDTVCTNPISPETWEGVIQALIARKCERYTILDKLASVLNQIPKHYFQYGKKTFTIAAKYYVEIQGAAAYSVLWSKVDRISWIFWDLLDEIVSIGPVIEKRLFEDLVGMIYDLPSFSEGILQYLEKLGPSSWSTEEFAWRFEDTKISLRMIDYFAGHDKTRALRELCCLFGIDDNGIKDFEYFSTCLQSLKMEFTEDEIVEFIYDGDNNVKRGALTCLVLLQTEKGDNLLEKLMTDINLRVMTLDVWAVSGNESQIFRLIDFLVNSANISENTLHYFSDVFGEIQYRFEQLGAESIKKLVQLYDTSTGIAHAIYSKILGELLEDGSF